MNENKVHSSTEIFSNQVWLYIQMLKPAIIFRLKQTF